jgi:hypothetical protein
MKSSKVWMVPFAMCLISSICNIVLTQHTAPAFYETGEWDGEAPYAVKHFYQVYMATYCRMSPYGFGMLAAYKHLEETKRAKAQKSYLDIEYIASWKSFGLELTSLAVIIYII